MENTLIFTTGAYLIPKQVDGVWYWVVSSFEEDSFKDGITFNPHVTAKTVDILTNTEEH